MNNEELNEKISRLDDEKADLPTVVKDEIFSSTTFDDNNKSVTTSWVERNSDTGKRIFYWGWYWRTVDFDRPISLAWDESGTAGFCQNNKWNYPMHTLSKEQSQELKRLCELAVENPSAETINAVNNFMGSCKPEDWLQQAQLARQEVEDMMKQIRK